MIKKRKNDSGRSLRHFRPGKKRKKKMKKKKKKREQIEEKRDRLTV